jgi:Transposase IS116/IS110/IS902 family
MCAQTIIAEVGVDMSRFPTEAHFASSLGLCADNRITGGKVLRRAVVKKVVFDDVQVSARNSTIPSRMGGKPEKSFELMRPTGAVE